MKIENLRRKHLHSLPPWEADSLLQLSCNKDKAFILTHPEYRLGFFELLKFYFALWQFKRGVPLAYITHHKEFYGLDFYVDKRVLTPRPETELVVEEVVKVLSTKYPVPSLLIDVGTGSGCVPIAIMKHWSTIPPSEGGRGMLADHLTVFATDISKPALEVARKNAKRHGVEIDFFHGNLLEPLFANIPLPPSRGELLITANLPYGWKAWKNIGSIETKRLNFEPQIALFTGENGLELYRKLLEQIAVVVPLLRRGEGRERSPLIGQGEVSEFPISPPKADPDSPSGQFLIYLEFDPRQTELLSKMISEILPSATFEIKKDLAGRDRLAVVSLE